jgi:hypothetical protein
MSKQRYSAQDMIDALKQAQGRVYIAAQLLGCSHTTVYNYLDTYPTVAQAKDEYEGKEIDMVELQLMKQINQGNLGAIIYYLKTKGRKRGWTEKIDINLDINLVNETMAALEALGKDPAQVFNEIIQRAARIKQDASGS